MTAKTEDRTAPRREADEREADEREDRRRARELHRRQRAYVLASILAVGRPDEERPARDPSPPA